MLQQLGQRDLPPGRWQVRHRLPDLVRQTELPLGHEGEGHGAAPEEIGAALRYLIDAPSVTGQMIAVDGGQHLAWRTPDVADD